MSVKVVSVATRKGIKNYYHNGKVSHVAYDHPTPKIKHHNWVEDELEYQYILVTQGVGILSPEERRRIGKSKVELIQRLHYKAERILNFLKNQAVDKSFNQLFGHSKLLQIDLTSKYRYVHNPLSLRELGISEQLVKQTLVDRGIINPAQKLVSL